MFSCFCRFPNVSSLCLLVILLLLISAVRVDAENENKDNENGDDSKNEEADKPAGVSSEGGREVWIGTAPFCKGSAEDCELFDLQFVREDSSGNGAKCWTGTKVLCRQKHLTSQLVPSAANELVVAVYNINEKSYTKEHSGQAERSCHIPRALLNKYPDLDVIIIVDLFIGGCMQNGQGDPPLVMGRMLSNYGFGHASIILGEEGRSFITNNGGVVIASRWPIVNTKEMVFANYAGMDTFVGRGAVYAGIIKHKIAYHVVGTQLQSGSGREKVRQEQAEELAMFVRDLELPSKQPLIIGGDFQTDYIADRETVDKLFKSIFAELPIIIGDQRANVDAESNELVVPEKNQKEWRDFVLFSTRHLKADHATIEIGKLLADKDIRYCASAPLVPTYVSPTAATCRKVRSVRQLSDHYPVVARFTFNDNEDALPKAFAPVLSENGTAFGAENGTVPGP